MSQMRQAVDPPLGPGNSSGHIPRVPPRPLDVPEAAPHRFYHADMAAAPILPIGAAATILLVDSTIPTSSDDPLVPQQYRCVRLARCATVAGMVYW